MIQQEMKLQNFAIICYKWFYDKVDIWLNINILTKVYSAVSMMYYRYISHTV